MSNKKKQKVKDGNDTSLAKKFMEESHSVLEDFLECTFPDILEDGNLNEIRESEINQEHIGKSVSEKLTMLGKKVEENAELFAQLEALNRGLKKDEVKRFDIKLLTQYMKYIADTNDVTQKRTYLDIANNKMPLACLGLVAKDIRNGKATFLHYSEKTVAVCWLFIQLMEDVGIDPKITCVNSGVGDNTPVPEVFSNGCSGVVTEHSDINAAVNAFLNPTDRYLWRIRKIFYQHTVSIQFIELLKGKCSVTEYKGKNAFKYGDKIFVLFDYKNLVELEDNVILVRKYWSVEHLLELLTEEEPYALSLWNDNLAETNKIAYGVNVPIVWVNDHGVFDGPAKVSQVFYGCFTEKDDEVERENFDKLSKLQKPWSKLSIDERIGKVKKVLEQLKTEKNCEGIAGRLEKVLQNKNMKDNTFTEIKNGKMCVGIEKANEMVIYTVQNNNIEETEEVVRRVINGSGIVWRPNKASDEICCLLKAFEKAKLPFIKERTYFSMDTCDYEDVDSFYKTRVIYTPCDTS